jgi:hypothetical protein
MRPELKQAKLLAEEQPDEALRICNKVLNECFDDEDAEIALFMSGYLMMQAERYGLAYNIFQRCAELRPNQSEIWSNMGMCLEDHDKERSIALFERAIKLNPKNESAIANKALMMLQTGRPKECINLCKLALNIKPDLRSAKHNMGLAKLMLRDWSGWKDYHDTLGVKHREARDYGLPNWDGEPGQVLVYGEQGVGDEIMFASCLEDLQKTNEIILDCDSRLESIFKRNFDFPIYGTRFKKQTPILDSYKPDFQCAIGQLPYFFRKKDSDYPGSPFLRPDPERVKQWDSIMGEGPRIGIAWSGGLPSTGLKQRTTSLDTFEPLFGNNLICLDYKEVNEQELKDKGIKYWERGVKKGADLEELLAIIANLDRVVTVCTTVVYFAGALGVPCDVLVPEWAGYRYHLKGGSFPWFNSVKLHRGDFKESVRRISAKNLYRIRPTGNDSVPRSMQQHNEKGIRAS